MESQQNMTEEILSVIEKYDAKKMEILEEIALREKFIKEQKA